MMIFAYAKQKTGSEYSGDGQSKQTMQDGDF